jgi:ankyrin repeat protein
VLVEAGAELGPVTQRGHAALHLAVESGQDKLVQYLVESGADMEQRNGDGLTALGIAALRGQTAIVRFLERKGAVVHAAQGASRATPLHLAALGGHAEVVRFLVECGAEVEVETCDGATPLKWARRQGHSEAVLCLRKAGASKGGAKPWSRLAGAARWTLVAVGAREERTDAEAQGLLSVALRARESRQTYGDAKPVPCHGR